MRTQKEIESSLENNLERIAKGVAGDGSIAEMNRFAARIEAYLYVLGVFDGKITLEDVREVYESKVFGIFNEKTYEAFWKVMFRIGNEYLNDKTIKYTK